MAFRILIICLFVVVLVVSTPPPVSSSALNISTFDNDEGVAPAYELLKRLFNSSPSSSFNPEQIFKLSIIDDSKDKHFTIQTTGEKNEVTIQGTSISEVTAGIGHYLRNYCNMTIGWPRGGGSRIYIPKEWPLVTTKLTMKRNAEFSYMMNVCTHSYSLVWYSWKEWEHFIDWAALSGINLVLAMTGQEEVQYKVFQKLGLKDLDIRSWFNGPAFLTWSRGQNEYGNNIAGPLPRSFMKNQWNLQKQILTRYRALGMVGQLPGFQGNVPIQLKELYNDSNITQQGDTGWMDSLDPLFQKIAKIWMETLIEDFSTQHWYQLDGYFNGGTAPWLEEEGKREEEQMTINNEENSIDNNLNSANDIEIDIMSYRRGVKAYQGLNATDPDAIWSFQGWAFINWNTPKQASFIKGFVDATPPGKFVVVDMSVNGEGEWHKWNNSAFFGAKFIWTTLHDFGGTTSMKGNLSQINTIPYAFNDGKNGQLYGTGFTPEGIDQNPIYYEFMLDQNWRAQPVEDIPSYCSARSHRRYGLVEFNVNVDKGWRLLCESAYTQDLSVQDKSGVPHLPGSASQFEDDRQTPTAKLCKEFSAWEYLIEAAASIDDEGILETLRYDVLNIGQEILSQLATPMSQNFSDAMEASVLDSATLSETGNSYIELLNDVDTLLKTDTAFMIGPWIEMAKALVNKGDDDCIATGFPSVVGCTHFYEWNARVQLTTWNPTNSSALKIPSGPVDYASKHWSGLIADYYGVRASLLLKQALVNAKEGKEFEKSERDLIRARHAYAWTTSTNAYPTEPVGNYLAISKEMYKKYSGYFGVC